MSDIDNLSYTNEKDAILRINDELKEADQILLKFKNKYWEKSPEYNKILQEYLQAVWVFQSSKENDLKISKEEWQAIIKEIQDIMLLWNKYFTDEKHEVEELNTTHLWFLKFKNGQFDGWDKKQIDMFLNSSVSISSLTNAQIGRLLSWVYDLWQNYINTFVERFVTDEAWLDHLIKKWSQPGQKSIDKYLSWKEWKAIPSIIKNKIIDEIITKMDGKIRNSLFEKFKNKNPNLSKEELNKKVDKIMLELKNVKEPELVFQILLKNLDRDVWMALKLSQTEIRKREFEEIRRAEWNEKDSQEKLKRLAQTKNDLGTLSTVRSQQTEENIKKFDASLIKISSTEQKLSTTNIIAKTVSDLESRWDCSDFVALLKRDLSKQIDVWNKEKWENKNTQETNSWVWNENNQTNDTLAFTRSDTWWYIIDTDSWKLELHYDEYNIVKDNKDALKNMIHFKNTLDDLGISKLWSYREDIFKTLSNKYGFAFQLEDDFINDNELNIFLKSVLNSIGIASKSDNIETTKLEFIDKNNISVIWWAQKDWVFDRSLIEKKFFEEYISLDVWFLSSKFVQNI